MRENLAPSTFVLIPCAGQGSRAVAAVEQGKPGRPGDAARRPALAKQYQLIAGKPMVLHTLQAFQALGPAVAGVCVVVSPQDDVFESALPGFAASGGHLLRCGGQTRAASVENGLAGLLAGGVAQAHDWVMVHDAARCLITPALITSLLETCRSDECGGLLAQPLADTLKTSKPASSATEGCARVSGTLPRADKWLAQTPQMFRIGALQQALAQARTTGLEITDEASAMEAAGGSPRLVPGSALNFKVTYPEDFALAESVLRGRGQ